MKILYITSGYYGYPHHYIDQFILTSLRSISHQVILFHLDAKIDWQTKLFKIISANRPDYVFSIHGGMLSESIVNNIKTYGAKVGIWFVDDPYDIDESKKKLYDYDFIFTNEKECISVYKRYGFKQVYYLPLGVQTKYYYPETPPLNYHSDICFVGSPFPKRVDIINHLYTKLSDLQIVLIGPRWKKHFPKKKGIIANPLQPDEVRKYYNGAKINLNIHRHETEHFIIGANLNGEQIKARSPNNRTFDISACSAFQLVDFREGLREYFNLVHELITFQNKEDLVKKIVYYLDHPEKRKTIANKGYLRTLRQSKFENRLKKMINIVGDQLKKMNIHEILKQGRLIKGGKPAVYFVLNGKKHLIPNTETFERYGFCWDDVAILSQEEVDKIPRGAIFK